MFEMEIGILAQIEDRLRTCSRVTVHGLRPRDELLDHYRRADVALDLMRRNNERDLAFTTRTVEYLWCGLPVVYGDYGELAPLVREYDAGWIVSPDDGDAIAETLRKILRDPADVRRRGANAQRLVRERLNWERTINPLDDFCRDPRRRSASHPPLVVAPTEAEALRAELTALRSTKTFRAFEPLRRLYARFRRA
jgi:glycosyltransferase involved in cell wall biosynthesis